MKILIVDDELPIREWLKLTMSGIKEQGIEVRAASNGREAWDICKMWRPDMVMTDIKMPKMTGLELLKMIKEHYLETYVVMLTSYSDFEYAREAIKYKASEYVLKNEITSETLDMILKNYKEAKVKIEDNNENVYMKDLIKTYEETGEFPYEIDEGNHVFAIACKDAKKEFGGIETYLNTFVSDIKHFIYEPGITVWVCTYKMLNSSGFMFGEAMEFCTNVSSLKEARIGFSGFIDDIPKACKRAREALDIGFYDTHSQVFYYVNHKDYHDEIKSYRKEIVSLVNKERLDEAKTMVDEFIKKIEKEKVTDIEYILKCIKDIIDAYKLSKIEYSGHEIYDYCEAAKEKVSLCKSIDELKECVNQFINGVKGDMSIEYNNYSNYVKSAIIYVSNHYMNIESVADVADYVNLNQDYFSRIFKSETGETFNSYLTNFRIEKAVELLEKTDLKIYEVGEKVGYPNLSYFSRVFKKVKGVNPFFYKN